MSETRNKVIKNFKVEDAKIIFKNFSGKGNEYNDEGNRNFGVLISDEDAEMLKADGWNIKYLRPLPDDPEEYRQPYMPVKVRYAEYPPIVYVIKEYNGELRKTKLDEDSIGQLDWSYIETADMIIRPYNYAARPNRPAGVSAYLKSLYVTIRQDDLELKYGSIPDTEDMANEEIEE